MNAPTLDTLNDQSNRCGPRFQQHTNTTVDNILNMKPVQFRIVTKRRFHVTVN